MKLMANKANGEGIDFLTLDFRDAFKQLHGRSCQAQQ